MSIDPPTSSTNAHGTQIGKCTKGLDVHLVPLDKSNANRLAIIFSKITPWVDYAISADNLDRYLSKVEPGAPRLAIAVGSRIVGVAGLRLNWLRGPYLQFLAIAPQYQRRRIGGLILKWLEREALATESANLWIMVSDIEGGARPFYESHGFKKECRISDLVTQGRDEILLRKKLKP